VNYGLTERQYSLITGCFSRFPEIEKVILFGSRAMGNFKPASDIDLMIVGEKITSAIIRRVFGILNDELSLPFKFDLVGSNQQLPEALKEHITGCGVVFYTSSSRDRYGMMQS
jgi:predicted nucleotidyltransferase